MRSSSFKIRDAGPEDIEKMSEMAGDFHRYGKFADRGLNLHRFSFSKYLNYLRGGPFGIVLVAEDNGEILGSIAGVAAPWLLDMSQKILTELWWWVDQKHHGGGVGTALIEEFMKRGESMNCSHVIMVTLAGDKEEKLAEIYKRMGFKHLEHHFIREL